MFLLRNRSATHIVIQVISHVSLYNAAIQSYRALFWLYANIISPSHVAPWSIPSRMKMHIMVHKRFG